MSHVGIAIAETLAAHGVSRAFLVPGESFLPVLDGLYDSPVEAIVTRQEGGAAYMAEAHGKATGEPGVAMVTRGPGAANAFGIFLLRQFATTSIPTELIESARIDGAGFFRTWWSVGVPMLRGGLAFLGIFTFIAAWNDYVWPLIILVDPKRQTLQTTLAQLNSVYATDYGMIMAGAVISVVPLIGVFIIGSRHFIANIAAGALKG